MAGGFSFFAFGKLHYAGRHFRIGELEKKRVVVVMTGLSMVS